MKSLIPLTVIVVCVGAYFMLISPKLKDINEKRVKLSEFNKTLNESKELKKILDGMLATYGSVPEDEKNKLDKIIPENFDSIMFTASVNSIATKNQLKLKEINTSQIKDEKSDKVVSQPVTGNYKVMTSQFTLSGSFERFVSFLKDVETSLELVDVKAVSIKPPGKDSRNSEYDFSIEMNTYYLR